MWDGGKTTTQPVSSHSSESPLLSGRRFCSGFWSSFLTFRLPHWSFLRLLPLNSSSLLRFFVCRVFSSALRPLNLLDLCRRFWFYFTSPFAAQLIRPVRRKTQQLCVPVTRRQISRDGMFASCCWSRLEHRLLSVRRFGIKAEPAGSGRPEWMKDEKTNLRFSGLITCSEKHEKIKQRLISLHPCGFRKTGIRDAYWLITSVDFQIKTQLLLVWVFFALKTKTDD